jgi:hypothetical protein
VQQRAREGKGEGRGGLLPQGEPQGPLDGSRGATVARRRRHHSCAEEGGLARAGEIRGGEDKLGCVPSYGCRGGAYRGKGHGGASTSVGGRARDGGEWRWLLPGVRRALG